MGFRGIRRGEILAFGTVFQAEAVVLEDDDVAMFEEAEMVESPLKMGGHYFEALWVVMRKSWAARLPAWWKRK